jgi:hypothetical protein
LTAPPQADSNQAPAPPPPKQSNSGDARNDLLNAIQNFGGDKSKLKKIEERKQEVKKEKQKTKESGLTVQEELALRMKDRRKFIGSDNNKKTEKPKLQDELPFGETSNNSDIKNNLFDSISSKIPPPPVKDNSDSEDSDAGWD